MHIQISQSFQSVKVEVHNGPNKIDQAVSSVGRNLPRKKGKYFCTTFSEIVGTYVHTLWQTSSVKHGVQDPEFPNLFSGAFTRLIDQFEE
jgi:hypothetical protein